MKQADLFSPPRRPPHQGEARGGPSGPSIGLTPDAPAATEPVPAWRAPAAPAPAPVLPAPAPVPSVVSVSELTRQIKFTLERGFTQVLVKGEISGFRGPNPRGHLYFSLKDADACLDAKIWASAAQKLKFKLRDGLSVVAEGSIDLYEPQGRYSLIITKLEPVGEGALALAFQQLKEKLAAEGLIGEKRIRPPRPIPFLPRRIGVITSVTGAALRDFLRVLHQRHPRLPVLVCDARMQGDGAPFEVVRALDRLQRTDVDVICLTRGGGSIEDLWTFNDERVARAIHACRVPVVSAIGHEVDYTIADFVADLRCATPSAAAEKLAPVLRELEVQLATHGTRLQRAVRHALLDARSRLERQQRRLGDPRRLLTQRRMALGEASDRMERALRGAVKERRASLKGAAERLHRERPQAKLQQRRQELRRLHHRLADPVRRQLSRARNDFQHLVGGLSRMNPLEVVARGYSLTSRADDGHLVRRGEQVKEGDRLLIRVADQIPRSIEEADLIEATVTAVRRKPSS
jgi:exodeoxyribonuclease VII large subunit